MAAGTGVKARSRERGGSRRDLARRVAPEIPPSPLAWRQSRMKTDVIDADSAPSQQPTGRWPAHWVFSLEVCEFGFLGRGKTRSGGALTRPSRSRRSSREACARNIPSISNPLPLRRMPLSEAKRCGALPALPVSVAILSLLKTFFPFLHPQPRAVESMPPTCPAPVSRASTLEAMRFERYSHSSRYPRNAQPRRPRGPRRDLWDSAS